MFYEVEKKSPFFRVETLLPLNKNYFTLCRINDNSSLAAKNKGKKRKIAETSNVITETLPSVEGEQVSTFKINAEQ